MDNRHYKLAVLVPAIVLALATGSLTFVPFSIAQVNNQAAVQNPDDLVKPLLKSTSSNGVPQPDQGGYRGPLPLNSVSAFDPIDGPQSRSTGLQDSLQRQPDSITGQQAGLIGWSGFYYYFAAGSSLHSADYTMRQDYQAGACISALDTGLQFLTLNLDLPQGARIDYLRIYFYDTDASNSVANIRKYDAAGNNTEIASVSSSGNAGFGTALSAYSGHVVDNTDGAYVLNWQPIVTGNTMQLCGLRVAYRLP
jgi:hypothetical protein